MKYHIDGCNHEVCKEIPHLRYGYIFNNMVAHGLQVLCDKHRSYLLNIIFLFRHNLSGRHLLELLLMLFGIARRNGVRGQFDFSHWDSPFKK